MLSTADDHRFMAHALTLAKKGQYTTMPNPQVGCVLVAPDGTIIGEGWHKKAGEPHAEVYALQQAGQQSKGATAYVTLEPCSHYGRTPPCADALIKAGVSRVVVAVLDVNPQVSGQGIQRLEAAGIQTSSGVLQEPAYRLNEGFFKRMTTGRPFVRAKLAMSLDGRTAMASGESQWITGSHARGEVQTLRAQSCAIITGVNSILLDDSALTVRANQLPLPNAEAISQRQPLRVILDSKLQTPPTAKAITGEGACLIVTTPVASSSQRLVLEKADAEVLELSNNQDHIDLDALLLELGRRECNNVLLETGATLAGAVVNQNLVDELVVFMAPTLMGSNARPLLTLPFEQMNEQRPLTITDIRAIGNDWKITARPASS